MTLCDRRNKASISERAWEEKSKAMKNPFVRASHV